jgi:hypothetical protein
MQTNRAAVLRVETAGIIPGLQSCDGLMVYSRATASPFLVGFSTALSTAADSDNTNMNPQQQRQQMRVQP